VGFANCTRGVGGSTTWHLQLVPEDDDGGSDLTLAPNYERCTSYVSLIRPTRAVVGGSAV